MFLLLGKLCLLIQILPEKGQITPQCSQCITPSHTSSEGTAEPIEYDTLR